MRGGDKTEDFKKAGKGLRGYSSNQFHCSCLLSGRKSFPDGPLKTPPGVSLTPEMSHIATQRFGDCQRLAHTNVICVGCIVENLNLL